MSELTKDIVELNKKIDDLFILHDQIPGLAGADNKATTDKQRDDVIIKLEKISSNFVKDVRSVRLDLRNFLIKHKMNIESDYAKIACEKINKVAQKFPLTVSTLKKTVTATTKRRLKYILPEITDKDMDSIIDNGKGSYILREALMTDNLKSIVSNIEERHTIISKIERDVLEIRDLFVDLATLIDLQAESLIKIEDNIDSAKNNVEKGAVAIDAAADYQKKHRKMMCCCMFTLLIVLLVILAPVLTKTSGLW